LTIPDEHQVQHSLEYKFGSFLDSPPSRHSKSITDGMFLSKLQDLVFKFGFRNRDVVIEEEDPA
jgi:hypothetical protein